MGFLRISLHTMFITGSLFSLHGMEEHPKSQVIIHNDLIGTYVSIPLKVTYHAHRSGEISRIISPGDIAYIGSKDIFLLGSAITFSGYGQIMGYSVKNGELLPEMLRSKWEEVKQSDTDPLVITISARQRLLGPSELIFEFSNKLPEKTVKAYNAIMTSGNPLAAFGRLRYWNLQNSLLVDELLRLTDDQIRKVLVPARTFQSATTAEDVFRYILGLDKQYTQADIQRAYIDLLTQWDPENIEGDSNKKYAMRVLILVEKAYTALLHSRGMLEWLVVGEYPPTDFD